jgi:23S rRNA (pseudouridine1915-N3)-methyltransferase
VKVLLYAFGKLKTPGLRAAADYYLMLARGWLPIDEIELKPLSVPDKSPATRRQIQAREGEQLLARMERDLSARARIVLLDEGGKNRSTREWAEAVQNWERESVQEVAFCIGSSLGFSDAVRAKAALSLSLGQQTLPHELARVVLAEQIYRAWGVTRGHPYHNEGA